MDEAEYAAELRRYIRLLQAELKVIEGRAQFIKSSAA